MQMQAAHTIPYYPIIQFIIKNETLKNVSFRPCFFRRDMAQTLPLHHLPQKFFCLAANAHKTPIFLPCTIIVTFDPLTNAQSSLVGRGLPQSGGGASPSPAGCGQFFPQGLILCALSFYR